MAKDFTVKARIQAQDDGATAVVGKVERAFSGMESVLQGIAGGVAAGLTLSFGQIVSKLGEFVRAAQESEDAAKGLDNALASVGAGGASISKALEDQAGALQKVTRFSDEAIVKGQTFAAAFIKSEDVLKRVTAASTDLATGLGIDLQTAFELVTKASQGHTETLGRYGITIDETVPKAQKFEALLGQINDRFGGRAAADARTYSGEVAKVGNAFGEVEEAIGRLITSSAAGNQTLHDLAALLNAAAEGANAASGETGFITESLDRFNTGMLRSIPLIGDLVLGLKRIQESRKAAADAEAAEATAADANAKAKQEQVRQAAEIALAEDLQARNLATLTAQLGSNTAAWEALNASKDRAKRIDAELAASGDALTKAARDLGITLTSEVNAALDAHRASLEAVEIARRQGLATDADVIAAKQAVSRAELEAAGITVQTTDAITSQGTAFRAGTDSANGYVLSIRNGVIPALIEAGNVAQTAAQKITGANDSMLGPLDKPGDPLPSNLGRTRGGVSLPVGVAGTATSNYFTLTTPLYGQVQAFKVASQGVGSGLATTFYTLPNGRVVTDDYTLWAVNPTLNPTGRF